MLLINEINCVCSDLLSGFEVLNLDAVGVQLTQCNVPLLFNVFSAMMWTGSLEG